MGIQDLIIILPCKKNTKISFRHGTNLANWNFTRLVWILKRLNWTESTTPKLKRR